MPGYDPCEVAVPAPERVGRLRNATVAPEEPIPPEKHMTMLTPNNYESNFVIETRMFENQKHKVISHSNFQIFQVNYNGTKEITLNDYEARELFKLLLKRYGGEYDESQRRFFGHSDPTK